ncbi:MAG: SRPBCC family protein [Pseudolabrys sp.]|nr:SRPBCC family protein [Pseudolabrys sp.]
MLTTLLVIAGIIVAAIVVVLILASMKPDHFAVARTATINAPPERIYPFIADFRRWTDWSPYEHRDPNLKRSFAGEPGAVGQHYAWEGNKNVGKGSMTVNEVAEPSKVGINLDFISPFACHNKVVFSLAPQGPSTAVTWHMQGPVPFMAKIMHVFMDMDKMCGKDFSEGLAKLKTQAETSHAQAA